jgi:hypothetical protein
MTGEMTTFEGDAKMIDSSTFEWTWCMKNMWGKKIGEGKGMMKRK